MTTLATSFAIGDFLARGSGACPGFRPFRRSDSASGYPFGNVNNYVCHKRRCDRRSDPWSLPAVLSSRKPLTLVFLNTTEIVHDVQRIVDPHLDWGPRRGGGNNPTTPPWLAVRCLAGRFVLSSPAWRPPAVRRNTPTTEVVKVKRKAPYTTLANPLSTNF